MFSSDIDSKPIANGQGWAIYRPENFINRSGKNTKGNILNVPIDTSSWYTVDPLTCIEIFKTNYLIQSTISRHAQIVSSLNFKIVPSSSIEDEIVYNLKRSKNLYDLIGDVEITKNDFKYNLQNKMRLLKEKKRHYLDIAKYLTPYYLKSDLSNFDRCIRQYAKDIKSIVNTSSGEIEDWITKPNNTIQFQDFLIQYVIDLLLHGKTAIQLPTVQVNKNNELVPIHESYEIFDGFQLLPGGSVFNIAHKYIGEDVILGEDYPSYIQLMYNTYGYGTMEPKIFNCNELSTAQYLPNSSLLDGFKPIDCILSAITEVNNFSSLMVNYANEDKPPEYLIMVVDDSSMFGTSSISDTDKVDDVEIERIQESINTKHKDESVRIMKQIGKDVKLLNIGKENILDLLFRREERIEKIINRVFNGTSNELSDQDTSSIINNGTGEVQNNIYYNSVIKPIIKTIENQFTHEIILNRFGYASTSGKGKVMWNLVFQDSESETASYNKATLAKQTGLLTTNEIRTLILGLDPTGDPNDDKLQQLGFVGEQNV